MKYDLPGNQNEILPNLLGLTTVEEVALAEFEGFLQTEIKLTEELTARTQFRIAYILKIHKLALEHIYSFAGKYRDVNLSKGGFPFAAARFLPNTMNLFEKEVLLELPNRYKDRGMLIKDIAKVHGELLFIHPFREGNGRTARILANLMVIKQGYPALQFDLLIKGKFQEYVYAIQSVADKDYRYMEQLVSSIFPG